MRCLIVDDSASFRTAAATMLDSGGVEVVGVDSNSAEAMVFCRELQPDVVLVDIALGAESGFELTEKLLGDLEPRPPAVILISTYDEQDLSEMIASSPAVGFVPKFALSVPAIQNLLATI